MWQSLPAVAKCSPVTEKSQQCNEFSFSSIEKRRFIEGTCRYSKIPALDQRNTYAFVTPNTLVFECAVGLHLYQPISTSSKLQGLHLDKQPIPVAFLHIWTLTFLRGVEQLGAIVASDGDEVINGVVLDRKSLRRQTISIQLLCLVGAEVLHSW